MIEVSIIICSYNRAKLLEYGLYSQLSQDFPPHKYEIVIMNDGSTDNTGQVVDNFRSRFPQHNIQYHYLKKTEGQYASPAYARNQGILAAKGKYIGFSDPEIIVRKDSLRVSYEFHEACKDDYIVLLCPFMLTEEETLRLEDVNFRDDADSIKKLLDLDSEERQIEINRNNGEDNFFSTFKREIAIKLRGVNEYYSCWGREGLDFTRRMREYGVKHTNKPVEDIMCYHLWHPLEPKRALSLTEMLLTTKELPDIKNALSSIFPDISKSISALSFEQINNFLKDQPEEDLNNLNMIMLPNLAPLKELSIFSDYFKEQFKSSIP